MVLSTIANGDFTGYEFQVPIFVVTHRPPTEAVKGENSNLSITFVTAGTEAAVEKAKKAAGTRDVTVVGGASTAQQCIKAGLADELNIGIVPSSSETASDFSRTWARKRLSWKRSGS